MGAWKRGREGERDGRRRVGILSLKSLTADAVVVPASPSLVMVTSTGFLFTPEAHSSAERAGTPAGHGG